MITVEVLKAAPAASIKAANFYRAGEWITNGVILVRSVRHFRNAEKRPDLIPDIQEWCAGKRYPVSEVRREPWTDLNQTVRQVLIYRGRSNVETAVDERCAVLLDGMRVFRLGSKDTDKLIGLDADDVAQVLVMPVKL